MQTSIMHTSTLAGRALAPVQNRSRAQTRRTTGQTRNASRIQQRCGSDSLSLNVDSGTSTSEIAFTAKPAVNRTITAADASARPVWFPGNKRPEHLEGDFADLPGNFGFDPLSLGSDADTLRWFQQSELIHCRWAMTAVVGILVPEDSLTAFSGSWCSDGAYERLFIKDGPSSLHSRAGKLATIAGSLDVPNWYESGKVFANQHPEIPQPALLFTELLLLGWVETKRWLDFKNPGSQADGSMGPGDGLKGQSNGYPGGWFDPLGLGATEDKELLAKYKENEVKNGRLAMVALVGFVFQHGAYPGTGPVANLIAHVKDPFHVTFATNGVSLPFLQTTW